MAEQCPGAGDQPPEVAPNGGPNPLTCIPQRIHCTPTEADGGEPSEGERIMIEGFLDTLSEVALAVASRKPAYTQGGK